MPFPLKVSPGDRAWFQPGHFGCQMPGASVIVHEVGRLYLRDTMGREFRRDDGLSARGPSYGRLWPSREVYNDEMARALALAKLSVLAGKVAKTTKGTRPSMDNIRQAASLLGIRPEALA